ncbi:MAG: HDOD domain-containing protein [Desulfobacterota bacterium]|nr:HDOD domain-containing protein [Thermodesulfobacteriota bacterium]
MVLNPQDLLKGYLEVSSLPMIYYKIDEVIHRPNTSMADIGKIVSQDPGLTVRLLRLVNSAFYNFPSKIETITQALVIIGTQQLRELVLATSIIHLFQGIPKDLVSMESFWRHSIACGLAARALASYRNEANVERFLIAGMVHDIGRLIMYKKIGDLSRCALIQSRAKGTPLLQEEREVIGFDHSQMGRVLLQAWKLPQSLEEVVAYHHHPQRADHYPVEAAIVHIADILINALQWGTSGSHQVPPFEPSAWDLLDLSPAILPPLLSQLRSQVQEVVHSILGGMEG